MDKLKSRTYVLKRKDAPLSLMIPSKGTTRKPLLYFDGKTNRQLRYSPNQPSPFIDEQDGNVVLEPIVFEDGMLHVPESNPILQQFLYYHPGNGRIFEELDSERDAQRDLEYLDVEVDALIAAKSMELTMMETVARIGLGIQADKKTSAELKRDVIVFAKKQPLRFMEILNDPLLKVQDIVARAFEQQILKMKNKNRDIYFNFPDNKSKFMTIPFGEHRISTVSKYLQSDEGIETLKLLERHVE